MGDSSIFVLMPYMAFGLFGAGVLLRYLLAQHQSGNLKEKLAEAQNTFTGRIWWISMVTLLLGHIAGLLVPRIILSWNANQLRLYMLEGLAGLAALAAVISSAALIVRQLRKSTASLVTELFEMVFLAFLFVGTVSGVLVAVLHRWGSSWGVTILTPYVLSILRGQPAAYLAAQMPFLVRLHIVSAFAALALIPFTRLSTFFVVALHRCVVAAVVPVRATANAASRWLARHNPNAWFWPEED